MFPMAAEERKKIWLGKWLEEYIKVSKQIDYYCQKYGVRTMWDQDGGRKINILYITALRVLQNYSKADPFSLTRATAARFFAFTWGNTHGAAVAEALQSHLNPPQLRSPNKNAQSNDKPR